MPFINDPQVRFRLWGSITSIYWTALAVLTHMPLKTVEVKPGGIELPPFSDKIFHVGTFGLLAMLLLATVDAYALLSPRVAAISRWRRAGFVWCIVAVYAAFDELLQPLTDRFGDPWDWLADVAGAALGMVSYRLLFRR